MRFRHGHDTIEAFRWTGDDSQREEPSWVVEALQKGAMWIDSPWPARSRSARIRSSANAAPRRLVRYFASPANVTAVALAFCDLPLWP